MGGEEHPHDVSWDTRTGTETNHVRIQEPIEVAQRRPPWRIAVLSVLVLGLFLLPYVQLPAWDYAASSLLIVALLAWRYGSGWRQRIGLGLSRRGAAIALVTFAACWWLFAFVIVPWLLPYEQWRLEPWAGPRRFRHVFQVLNEELVLGAWLLFALETRVRHRVLLALGTGGVFGFLHFALYYFGSQQSSLQLTTVLTLISVGALRNALILGSRHIGHAFAVHCAWNLVMFSGAWVERASGRPLREPELFDALLGAPVMLCLSSTAAACALWQLGRRPAGGARRSD